MQKDMYLMNKLLNDTIFILEPHPFLRDSLASFGGGWILEPACGSSKISFGLSFWSDCPSIAIDYNEEVLNYAKKLALTVDSLTQTRTPIIHLKADVLEPNFPHLFSPNFFSLIISEGFVEHLSKTTRDGFMNTQLELLKPNGTLVVMVPNNESEVQKLKSEENHPLYGDEEAFTDKKLHSYMQTFGLVDLQTTIFPNYKRVIFSKGKKKPLNNTTSLY